MKRHLLTVTVFLLVGAVVNVAVAWGSAAFVDVTKSSGVERGRNSAWHVMQRRVVSGSRVVVFHRTANRDILLATQDGRSALEGLSAFDEGASFVCKLFPSRLRSLPGWVSIDESTQQTQDVVAIEIDDARGWPMPAVQCRILPQSPRWRTIEAVQDGVRLPRRRGVHPWLGFRAAPLRPVWPGFAINTLFYAVVGWLSLCGLFALRGFIRIRRGYCPKCTYPIGESAVCTECGSELARRTSQHGMS